jgi:hypothetical protein
MIDEPLLEADPDPYSFTARQVMTIPEETRELITQQRQHSEHLEATMATRTTETLEQSDQMAAEMQEDARELIAGHHHYDHHQQQSMRMRSESEADTRMA